MRKGTERYDTHLACLRILKDIWIMSFKYWRGEISWFLTLPKYKPEKKMIRLSGKKCVTGITKQNWALVGAYVYQLHIGGGAHPLIWSWYDRKRTIVVYTLDIHCIWLHLTMNLKVFNNFTDLAHALNLNWLIFSLVQQPPTAAGHIISISCKGNEIYFRMVVTCLLQNTEPQ